MLFYMFFKKHILTNLGIFREKGYTLLNFFRASACEISDMWSSGCCAWHRKEYFSIFAVLLPP